MVRVLAALSFCGSTNGHGAVVWPPTRNAVDHDLAPWNGQTPEYPGPSVESMTGWCPVSAYSQDLPGLQSARMASNPELSGKNGQACFWFSNGCAIGCAECDGSSRGPVPNNPRWNHTFPVCENNTAKATICDPKKRTVNRDAECGAVDDYYYYSPWRAPGSAPVFDPCGMAGGHKPPQGGFGGIYVNTTHAKLGDRGTEVLPESASKVIWAAGSVYEVTWTIEANHGGGYQYRLAPKTEQLTEELFQKIPLEFVGKQTLRYGGVRGKQLDIDGVYVSEGTSPPGSTWVMNPIPRNDAGQTRTGFTPPCAGSDIPIEKCQGMTDGAGATPELEIVDRIRIPGNLPAGDYVLGWRWDCEESNQIWQSCSDVTLTEAKDDISV